MPNKSGKITPIRLSNEARTEIDRRKSESGNSLVKIVEEAIMGHGRFNPRIEAEISLYQRENNCSRPDAVEAMLIEAVALRYKNSNSTPKLDRLEKNLVREDVDAVRSQSASNGQKTVRVAGAIRHRSSRQSRLSM